MKQNCAFSNMIGFITLVFITLLNYGYSDPRTRDFWDHMKNSFQNVPRMPVVEVFDSRQSSFDGVDNIQGGVSGVIDRPVDLPLMEIDVPKWPYRPQLPRFTPFFQQQNHWWEGPNVCVDREEIDEGNQSTPFLLNFQSQSCVQTDLAFKCTSRIISHGILKTLVVSFHCCHSYHRHNIKGTCEKVDLHPLLDTIKQAGGSIFADLISFSGLVEKFQKENLTVFCPTDLALKSFHEDFENNVVVMTPNVQKRSADSNDHLVLSHVVKGIVKSSEFMDEKVLTTENPQAGIRLNVYNLPERVMTANCAKILSINNFATNGVVHMVNRVLPPVTQTVGEIISTNPSFSIFKSLLEQNHLLETLMDRKHHMTLLVPTDEAFHQLHVETKEKLLRGEGCVANILKYHILLNVVCEEILPARARSATLFGPDVKFRRFDERLLVNDVHVETSKQQMGTNGVVYPLEGVLIPNQAKSLTTILDDTQLSDLVDLLEEAKLKEKLDKMKNFTFFAPTNRAIRQARPYLDELRRNSPDKLQDLILYHVGFPATVMCYADNNQQIESAMGNKKIRFNQFTSMFGLSHQITAQCAKIVEMDGQVCGGALHIVEQVLVPPVGNLADVIASNQSFSFFRKLLQLTEFETEIAEHGPYTILVPTDAAFYALPEDVLHQMLRERDLADSVVRNHILPEVLCCAGIPPHNYMVQESVRALNGALHPLQRFRGSAYVGGSKIKLCDMMGDNGVVHSINSVLLPPNQSPDTHYVHRQYYLAKK